MFNFNTCDYIPGQIEINLRCVPFIEISLDVTWWQIQIGLNHVCNYYLHMEILTYQTIIYSWWTLVVNGDETIHKHLNLLYLFLSTLCWFFRISYYIFKIYILNRKIQASKYCKSIISLITSKLWMTVISV